MRKHRTFILAAAAGVIVTVLCEHFGFSGFERWSCVVAVGALIGALTI